MRREEFDSTEKKAIPRAKVEGARRLRISDDIRRLAGVLPPHLVCKKKTSHRKILDSAISFVQQCNDGWKAQCTEEGVLKRLRDYVSILEERCECYAKMLDESGICKVQAWRGVSGFSVDAQVQTDELLESSTSGGISQFVLLIAPETSKKTQQKCNIFRSSTNLPFLMPKSLPVDQPTCHDITTTGFSGSDQLTIELTTASSQLATPPSKSPSITLVDIDSTPPVTEQPLVVAPPPQHDSLGLPNDGVARQSECTFTSLSHAIERKEIQVQTDEWTSFIQSGDSVAQKNCCVDRTTSPMPEKPLSTKKTKAACKRRRDFGASNSQLLVKPIKTRRSSVKQHATPISSVMNSLLSSRLQQSNFCYEPSISNIGSRNLLLRVEDILQRDSRVPINSAVNQLNTAAKKKAPSKTKTCGNKQISDNFTGVPQAYYHSITPSFNDCAPSVATPSVASSCLMPPAYNANYVTRPHENFSANGRKGLTENLSILDNQSTPNNFRHQPAQPSTFSIDSLRNSCQNNAKNSKFGNEQMSPSKLSHFPDDRINFESGNNFHYANNQNLHQHSANSNFQYQQFQSSDAPLFFPSWNHSQGGTSGHKGSQLNEGAFLASTNTNFAQFSLSASHQPTNSETNLQNSIFDTQQQHVDSRDNSNNVGSFSCNIAKDPTQPDLRLPQTRFIAQPWQNCSIGDSNLHFSSDQQVDNVTTSTIFDHSKNLSATSSVSTSREKIQNFQIASMIPDQISSTSNNNRSTSSDCHSTASASIHQNYWSSSGQQIHKQTYQPVPHTPNQICSAKKSEFYWNSNQPSFCSDFLAANSNQAVNNFMPSFNFSHLSSEN